ncbi:MAG: type II toxin-antitoxin system HicB family antitoxin [Candidatus Kerfeldbacteria bacterium]|nr:type II toxin-antitoxin system HicB family antitoxin [Candidatus Kerfeldbacteria bacterium]
MNTFSHIPRSVLVRLHQEEDGRFWAELPDLPGCYTQGTTLDEALRNMKDAIFTYFEVAKEQADPALLRYEGETIGEFVTA